MLAVVWQRSSSHRSEVVRVVGFPLIRQPAYAPELNPAERLFEELGRVEGGHVYVTMDDQVNATEAQF